MVFSRHSTAHCKLYGDWSVAAVAAMSKGERLWLIFDRVIAGIIVAGLYLFMQRGC